MTKTKKNMEMDLEVDSSTSAEPPSSNPPSSRQKRITNQRLLTTIGAPAILALTAYQLTKKTGIIPKDVARRLGQSACEYTKPVSAIELAAFYTWVGQQTALMEAVSSGPADWADRLGYNTAIQNANDLRNKHKLNPREVQSAFRRDEPAPAMLRAPLWRLLTLRGASVDALDTNDEALGKAVFALFFDDTAREEMSMASSEMSTDSL